MLSEKIRVFINGFGRIGRSAARILLEDERFELVLVSMIFTVLNKWHIFFNMTQSIQGFKNVLN